LYKEDREIRNFNKVLSKKLILNLIPMTNNLISILILAKRFKSLNNRYSYKEWDDAEEIAKAIDKKIVLIAKLPKEVEKTFYT